MPNGKPGDHPLTDIVVHGIPTYTAAIDGLIREIHALAPHGEALSRLLWDRYTFYPRGSNEELQADLHSLREHLLRLPELSSEDGPQIPRIDTNAQSTKTLFRFERLTDLPAWQLSL